MITFEGEQVLEVKINHKISPFLVFLSYMVNNLGRGYLVFRELLQKKRGMMPGLVSCLSRSPLDNVLYVIPCSRAYFNRSYLCIWKNNRKYVKCGLYAVFFGSKRFGFTYVYRNFTRMVISYSFHFYPCTHILFFDLLYRIVRISGYNRYMCDCYFYLI